MINNHLIHNKLNNKIGALLQTNATIVNNTVLSILYKKFSFIEKARGIKLYRTNILNFISYDK